MNNLTMQMKNLSDGALFTCVIGEGPMARDAGYELDARFRGRLERSVSGVLGVRSADIQDVVQCAFLNMWEHRHDGPKEDEHFRRWLFTVARCVAVDFVRKRGAVEPLPEIGPAALGPGPQTQVRRKERDDRLHEAVARLPPPIQAAVRLRVLQGCEVAEAAKALDVSTRRIRKRVEAGCDLLRPMLGPEFWELTLAA